MEPIKLAIFDFDGTLLPGDSIVPYVRMARKMGYMSWKQSLSLLLHAPLWLMKIWDDSAFKSCALRFYAQMDQTAREKLNQAFLQECILPRLYKMGLAALNARKQEGFYVLLLSASTDNYMQDVAKALQVDGLICTRLDENARIQVNCKGQNKVTLLQAYISENHLDVDWDASCAYGDSRGDLHVMELVGSPIIVNGKRKLIKAAPHLPQVHWQ